MTIDPKLADLPANVGAAAQARRLYQHVCNGGAVTPQDICRIVATIEKMEAALAASSNFTAGDMADAAAGGFERGALAQQEPVVPSVWMVGDHVFESESEAIEEIRQWGPSGSIAVPLYAAPPAAQADTLSERMQQKCSDWGTYWRAPDAHGVILSVEQASELLRDVLLVDVEIKPGAPAVDLEQFDAAVEAELRRVSSVEYRSDKICEHFAGELRKRLIDQQAGKGMPHGK